VLAHCRDETRAKISHDAASKLKLHTHALLHYFSRPISLIAWRVFVSKAGSHFLAGAQARMRRTSRAEWKVARFYRAYQTA
jgi:hypothetical protein